MAEASAGADDGYRSEWIGRGGIDWQSVGDSAGAAGVGLGDEVIDEENFVGAEVLTEGGDIDFPGDIREAGDGFALDGAGYGDDDGVAILVGDAEGGGFEIVEEPLEGCGVAGFEPDAFDESEVAAFIGLEEGEAAISATDVTGQDSLGVFLGGVGGDVGPVFF